jgi:hypothetical protein
MTERNHIRKKLSPLTTEVKMFMDNVKNEIAFLLLGFRNKAIS